jgi:hypothetical protein
VYLCIIYNSSYYLIPFWTFIIFLFSVGKSIQESNLLIEFVNTLLKLLIPQVIYKDEFDYNWYIPKI